MLSLLQAPEIWIGLGLFLIVAYLLLGGVGQGRRMHKRIDRIAQQKPRTIAEQGSLRKRDPSSETALGQAISGFSITAKIRRKLETAGMQSSPQRFLGMMLGLGIISCVLVILAGKPFLLALLFGILVGLGVPNRIVARRINKRKKAFLTQLPDAIDLIVRGLRAGLPVAESFQTVSREIPKPLGDVFASISRQIGLGVPLEKALSDAAENMDLTEFNFFVTTIILQRETGGNLGEILSNLAEVLRGRRMMKLKIGAISSEARASAYIIGALPFVVFGILNVISPDYIAPLYHDYRGNMAMAAAGTSLFFGGFIMRKMTQFEI